MGQCGINRHRQRAKCNRPKPYTSRPHISEHKRQHSKCQRQAHCAVKRHLHRQRRYRKRQQRKQQIF